MTDTQLFVITILCCAVAANGYGMLAAVLIVAAGVYAKQ
jgi:hypothetical protein